MLLQRFETLLFDFVVLLLLNFTLIFAAGVQECAG